VDPSRNPRTGPGSALARAVARLRGWLRPPRILRPTRAGWSFFAITFGVGFAALNTGNNLLYLVLSLMLAFLVLSGVLSESALRGVQVRRRLPREIFAGAENPVTLEITNRQRRVPAFALVIEDRLRTAGGPEAAAGRVFALRIGAGATEVRGYRLVPDQRGPLEFVGFQVSTRFPFGLFSKSLTLAESGEALVYPGVDPLPVSPGLGGTPDEGECARDTGDGASAASLREFAPGDPMRRIHWPASLRRGSLYVRQLESARAAEVEVRLRTQGVADGLEFERGVRWAASEVVALLDAGRRVALRTDAAYLAADAGAGQRARLLSFLARVAPGSAARAEGA
jgi:uncharacterized protein (DUF58 family)